MATREEIREGIAEGLFHFDHPNEEWGTQNPITLLLYQRRADRLLAWENELGVVIKVKCPDCEWSQFEDGAVVGMTPCHSCNSTGFIFEPLIEDGKDNSRK